MGARRDPRRAARDPAVRAAQDEGRWDQHITDTLTGKRVLLVGAGDLADQTARRMETFDVAAITRVGRRARDGVHATSELPDLLPATTTSSSSSSR